jgi:hypothetical protein
VAAGIGAPVLLALVGPDYVLARNVLPVWLPAAVVVAAGIAVVRSGRLGVAMAAALVVGSLVMTLAVPLDRTLQREAVTAALSPGRLQAEDQRIAVSIAYAATEDGAPARAGARCPSGYSAANGSASWLSEGADEPLPEGLVVAWHGGRQATAPPARSRGRPLLVYSVCTRPAD